MSDAVIATAMLDRLLDHSYVINIRRKTYRLMDLMLQDVTTDKITEYKYDRERV